MRKYIAMLIALAAFALWMGWRAAEVIGDKTDESKGLIENENELDSVQ